MVWTPASGRRCAVMDTRARLDPTGGRRPGGRRLRIRLAASVGGTIALVLVMSGLAATSLAITASDLSSRTELVHGLREVASRLTTVALVQSAETYEMLAGGGEEDLGQFDESRQALAKAEGELRALATGDPQLVAVVDRVTNAIDAWQAHFADHIVELVRRGERPDISKGEDGEAYEEAMLASLDELQAALSVRRQATASYVAETSARLVFALLLGGCAVAVLLLVGGRWLFRSIGSPLGRLNETAQSLVEGKDVSFATERDDEIGALAVVLERLRLGAAERYEEARREAAQAAAFNQMAELMSFALDEPDLMNAAVRTLGKLVPSPAGDVMLINASQNRLSVSATWGTPDVIVGSPVDVERVDRCPGIRRATAYIAADIGDGMTVRCPAHPMVEGSLMCVPMPALGEIVGVIHLANPSPHAFTDQDARVAARIAEQVALAIANARLMGTMQGLAMTDPLTGLHNARFFDPYLEQELAASERDQSSLAIIMIDVDHFKRFNDAHGHPGGDEALKAFARAVRSSVRSSDVIARYGGEEFVICARHTSIEDAVSLAEKIRVAVEHTVVELGPGRFARITASFGVASTADRRLDRLSLLRTADEALYQAKEAGRNRVVAARSTRSRGDTRRGSRAAGAEAVDIGAADHPPA